MSDSTECRLLVELVRVVPLTILGLMTWWISRQQKEISRRQLQTTQQKLKFDLYERRLNVYGEVTGFISTVLRTLKPTDRDLATFMLATSEADFLFGTEVKNYIEELHDHATALWKWNNMYQDLTETSPPPDYDDNKVVAGRQHESLWFLDQWKHARDAFAPYLDLSKYE